MSSYAVSDSGDFTNAKFNQLLADAAAILALDLPELGAGALYDRLHVTLILGLYETGLPKASLTGEKIGDYSYTKQASTNAFLASYEALAAKIRAGASDPELGVYRREDADMPSMQLDANDIPDFGARE